MAEMECACSDGAHGADTTMRALGQRSHQHESARQDSRQRSHKQRSHQHESARAALDQRFLIAHGVRALGDLEADTHGPTSQQPQNLEVLPASRALTMRVSNLVRPGSDSMPSASSVFRALRRRRALSAGILVKVPTPSFGNTPASRTSPPLPTGDLGRPPTVSIRSIFAFGAGLDVLGNSSRSRFTDVVAAEEVARGSGARPRKLTVSGRSRRSCFAGGATTGVHGSSRSRFMSSGTGCPILPQPATAWRIGLVQLAGDPAQRQERRSVAWPDTFPDGRNDLWRWQEYTQ